LAMLSPLTREASLGMLFTKATRCEKSLEYARRRDDHVVRARNAHGLQERGFVGNHPQICSTTGLALSGKSKSRAFHPLLTPTWSNVAI